MKNFIITILFFVTLQSCEYKKERHFIHLSGEFYESILNLQLKNNQKFQLKDQTNTTINLSHSDKSFNDTLTIAEGYYDLIINDKAFLLYLKNGHKLNLSIKEEFINIDGLGKKENIYLQHRVELEKDLSSQNYYQFYSKLDESNFLSLADSIYNLRLDLIRKSELDNSKFKFIEESLVKLDRAHKFLNYPFTRSQIDSTYTPSHNFPETFKGININDERLIDLPYYSLLMFLNIVNEVNSGGNQPSDPIIEYLNFVLNDNLGITNKELKEEIAYKTVSLTIEKTKNLDKLFRIYKNFSRDSTYLKEITKKYIDLKKLPTGAIAPNFSIPNENGNLISLDEFKGNVVYIDFWATWCKPCLSEIDPSKKLQKKLAQFDIKFLNICIESKYNLWSNLLAAQNIQGINLFANNEIEDELKENYFIQGLPRYVIIDKEGKIFDFAAKKPSDPELEKDLKSLL